MRTILALLSLCWISASLAQTPQTILLSERRISRTVFEYQYRLVLTNNGTNPWNALTLSVASNTPYTTIVTPSVSFGDVQPGTTVQSQSALVLRHDRTVPFDWAKLAFDSSIGEPVSFTPPPPPQAFIDALPKNPATGRPILSAVPGGNLEIDQARRDPLTAVDACTAWIASCVSGTGKALDDCTRSAPACTTPTPWNESACCPTECGKEYRALRIAGRDALAAFMETYLDKGTCFPQFPGVRELLRRGG